MAEDRITKAKELYKLGEKKLEIAKVCANGGMYRDCVELAYYAVLYGIKAVFELDFDVPNSQPELFALFHEVYVQELQSFPGEAWDRITSIRALRDLVEYGESGSDAAIPNIEDIHKHVETAEYILLLCNINLVGKGVDV